MRSRIATVVSSGMQMRHNGSHTNEVLTAIKIDSQLRSTTSEIRNTVNIRFSAYSSQKMVRPMPT